MLKGCFHNLEAILITVSLGLVTTGTEWVGQDVQHWIRSSSGQDYSAACLTLVSVPA